MFRGSKREGTGNKTGYKVDIRNSEATLTHRVNVAQGQKMCFFYETGSLKNGLEDMEAAFLEFRML